MKLKSKIFFLLEVYVVQIIASRLPLNAGFLWSASSVPSNPGNFVDSTTALRVPSGTDVGDCRLESVVPN